MVCFLRSSYERFHEGGHTVRMRQWMLKLWEPRATAAAEPSRVVEPTAAAEPKLLGSWPR